MRRENSNVQPASQQSQSAEQQPNQLAQSQDVPSWEPNSSASANAGRPPPSSGNAGGTSVSHLAESDPSAVRHEEPMEVAGDEQSIPLPTDPSLYVPPLPSGSEAIDGAGENSTESSTLPDAGADAEVGHSWNISLKLQITCTTKIICNYHIHDMMTFFIIIPFP